MKKVFEYMGWENRLPHKTVYDSLNEPHPLDGNDMVLAINKMWDKGDWYKFQYYCEAIYEKGSEQLAANVWLFGSPDNFFKLMEEWLNERN